MAAQVNVDSSKRRKYSKNKKKNWRKFTDIEDITEALEDSRRIERIGGPAGEKTDAELFVVSRQPQLQEGAAPLAGRAPRVLRSEMHLRPQAILDSSDEELTASSRKRKRVGMPFGKKSTPKQPANGSSRQPLAARQMKDIWTEESNRSEPGFHDDHHYLWTTRKIVPKVPKSLLGNRTPSLLPAVPMPTSGESYRPRPQDHAPLVLRAQVERAESRRGLDRVRRWASGLAPLNQAEKQKIMTEESMEGLFLQKITPEGAMEALSEEIPSAPKGSEDEGSGGGVYKRPIRAEDRKTSKQNRKAHLVKTEAKLRAQQKGDRKRLAEVFRLKTLQRQLRREQQAWQGRAEEKAEKERRRETIGTKRLGRLRFVEPVLKVRDSAELSKPLRLLKSHGSILRDRYKSLQRRNMIVPPQKAVHKRKYKKKTRIVEKHSARMLVDGVFI